MCHSLCQSQTIPYVKVCVTSHVIMCVIVRIKSQAIPCVIFCVISHVTMCPSFVTSQVVPCVMVFVTSVS